MFGPRRTGSLLCPSCGQLVGVDDDLCLNCGRRRPGLLAQSRILTALAQQGAFATLVLWACGALYLASVVVNLEGIAGDDVMSFLSPAPESLFLFGASGSIPVFHFGRFWTVLSAGWLHGGLLHIVFNLMWVRNLAPVTAHLYGTSRTVIIYTVSSVTGFLASSLAGQFLPFLPSFLHGAGLTIGASASIFGLMGALLYYGRRSGSPLLTQQVKDLGPGRRGLRLLDAGHRQLGPRRRLPGWLSRLALARSFAAGAGGPHRGGAPLPGSFPDGGVALRPDRAPLAAPGGRSFLRAAFVRAWLRLRWEVGGVWEEAAE